MNSLLTMGGLNFLAGSSTYLEVKELKKNFNQFLSITQKLEQQKAQIEQVRAIRKEYQQFLKNIYFEIRSKITEILDFDDNLSKFVYLKRLSNDMEQLTFLEPNQLEDIQDKEYALETIRLYEKSLKSIAENFSEEDMKDFEFLNLINTKKDELEKSLKGTKKTLNRFEKDYNKNGIKIDKIKEKLYRVQVRLSKLTQKKATNNFLSKIVGKLNNSKQEKLTKETNTLKNNIKEIEETILPQLDEKIKTQKSLLENANNKYDEFNKQIKDFFDKYPKLDFLRGFWSSLFNRGLSF